jgi:hypothetical protein
MKTKRSALDWLSVTSFLWVALLFVILRAVGLDLAWTLAR